MTFAKGYIVYNHKGAIIGALTEDGSSWVFQFGMHYFHFEAVDCNVAMKKAKRYYEEHSK